MLSIEDDAGIERVLAEKKTRLVCFESPTNPVTRIADIARDHARGARGGALTVMDNTFAGFHNHGQYDVDVFVHSLTKYASGHGDVMGGAIIGDRELRRGIRPRGRRCSGRARPARGLPVMRGMKTYYLRYEAQAAARRCAIAQFLAEAHRRSRASTTRGCRPPAARARARADARVRHDRQLRPRAGAEAVRAFVDALEFFAVDAEPRLGRVARDAAAAPARCAGCPRNSRRWRESARARIRLSIGIEDTDELIEDLDAALGGGR